MFPFPSSIKNFGSSKKEEEKNGRAATRSLTFFSFFLSRPCTTYHRAASLPSARAGPPRVRSDPRERASEGGGIKARIGGKPAAARQRRGGKTAATLQQREREKKQKTFLPVLPVYKEHLSASPPVVVHRVGLAREQRKRLSPFAGGGGRGRGEGGGPPTPPSSSCQPRPRGAVLSLRAVFFFFFSLRLPWPSPFLIKRVEWVMLKRLGFIFDFKKRINSRAGHPFPPPLARCCWLLHPSSFPSGSFSIPVLCSYCSTFPLPPPFLPSPPRSSSAPQHSSSPSFPRWLFGKTRSTLVTRAWISRQRQRGKRRHREEEEEREKEKRES